MSSQVTYLERILAAHRVAAAEDRRDVDKLVAKAQEQPPTRGFADAIRRADGVAVIAEVKRRSPSRGDLFPDLDPVVLARSYEAGGAACLSVLTDRDFFGGSPEDLQAARAATSLPVLRKDFTLTANDVCDARIMGADAVLLIVAALEEAQLHELHDLAVELGLDALVEVHDEPDLELALEVGATLVGVNQRDLYTFHVDTHRAVQVAEAMPEWVLSVAESGIIGPEDVVPLREVGFDAVLVGESVVTSGDPGAAVAALRSA